MQNADFKPARRAAVVALLGLSLASCSSLTASPPATFDLTAPRSFPGIRPGARGQLIIGEPKALQILDGERIAVREGVGQIAFLGRAQWADRLPKLLQARILEALENSSRLTKVARPGDRLASDYLLVTELRHFEIVVDAAGTSAVVEIAAKISNDKSGRILAGSVFRATRPANTEPAIAARALDEALGDVLRGLVVFAARSV